VGSGQPRAARVSVVRSCPHGRAGASPPGRERAGIRQPRDHRHAEGRLRPLSPPRHARAGGPDVRDRAALRGADHVVRASRPRSPRRRPGRAKGRCPRACLQGRPVARHRVGDGCLAPISEPGVGDWRRCASRVTGLPRRGRAGGRRGGAAGVGCGVRAVAATCRAPSGEPRGRGDSTVPPCRLASGGDTGGPPREATSGARSCGAGGHWCVRDVERGGSASCCAGGRGRAGA
jgi:hypothetical protein